jgi:hypothetical protein
LRIIDCEWDEWNVSHIRDHFVEPYEVEEVFANRPFYRKVREGKYMAFGQNDSGRYLAIVFAYRGQSRAYPITARDASWKEVNYAKRKGKK